VTARALGAAFSLLARYPLAPLLAYIVSLLAAMPAAVLMTQTLSATARASYDRPLGRGAVPSDWWLRLDQHGSALAGDFTPQTLGFAATLDTLALAVDGTRAHAAIVALAATAFAVAWACIWAVVLSRFGRKRPAGAVAALAAARRWAPAMLLISLAASAALFVSHLLFAGSVLWPLFTASLVVLAVITDLARARVVLTDERSLRGNMHGAVNLLRRHPGTVILMCLVLFALHAVVLAGYGVAEVVGGPRVGGWRAVAVAQLYIAVRIVLRLLWGTGLFWLAQQELTPASR
jgi:hypothetical protein